MPHPHLAVTWSLRCTRLPRARHRCARCAAPSTFEPTGKFRVNANRKSLDVWLLLRCTGCGHVVKATVVERSPVRSIDAVLLQRYHQNDPQLVAETLLNQAFRRRNRLALDWAGVWVLDADPIHRWHGQPVTVSVEFADPVEVRPIQLIALGLRASRGEVERLIAADVIRSPTNLRAPTATGFRFTVAQALAASCAQSAWRS